VAMANDRETASDTFSSTVLFRTSMSVGSVDHYCFDYALGTGKDDSPRS
jgi:hypothetical protein